MLKGTLSFTYEFWGNSKDLLSLLKSKIFIGLLSKPIEILLLTFATLSIQLFLFFIDVTDDQTYLS